MQPKYKRILLKFSGEALAGDKGVGIDDATVESVSKKVVELSEMGVEIAIVVGGGNIFRGRSADSMERTTADYMGMLATVINALALQDCIERNGGVVRVQSAVAVNQVCEQYIQRRAIRHLEKGRIVIFAAGIGSPYFSTDTAAALRAAEIHAEIILSAKNIDGVYDSDPKKNPDAKKYNTITYREMIDKGLAVIDTTAAAMCMDNATPLMIFPLIPAENIIKAACGENIGTLIN